MWAMKIWLCCCLKVKRAVWFNDAHIHLKLILLIFQFLDHFERTKKNITVSNSSWNYFNNLLKKITNKFWAMDEPKKNIGKMMVSICWNECRVMILALRIKIFATDSQSQLSRKVWRLKLGWTISKYKMLLFLFAVLSVDCRFVLRNGKRSK